VVSEARRTWITGREGSLENSLGSRDRRGERHGDPPGSRHGFHVAIVPDQGSPTIEIAWAAAPWKSRQDPSPCECPREEPGSWGSLRSFFVGGSMLRPASDAVRWAKHPPNPRPRCRKDRIPKESPRRITRPEGHGGEACCDLHAAKKAASGRFRMPQPKQDPNDPWDPSKLRARPPLVCEQP